MKKKKISASVHVDPNEIVTHLVGLKDVRILYYARRGPVGEIAIEQVLVDPRCPGCDGPTRVKDRPVVAYCDLPFAGVPITILWKKHRLICVSSACPVKSFTRGDHRIAAVGCRLTTRAAKWVVREIGADQHVSHLAHTLGSAPQSS